jgi:hypothetical protein
VLTNGVQDGSFRPELDVELAFRFLRDTVWVAVRWYEPGGVITVDNLAKQYLTIVLDGLTMSESSSAVAGPPVVAQASTSGPVAPAE